MICLGLGLGPGLACLNLSYLTDVDADAGAAPRHGGGRQHTTVPAAEVEDQVVRANLCWICVVGL